jgi:hypothetical protein
MEDLIVLLLPHLSQLAYGKTRFEELNARIAWLSTNGRKTTEQAEIENGCAKQSAGK